MPVARRALLACLAVVVLSLLGAGPAAASCAIDDRGLADQLAEAELVFVGTVTDVRHDTTAQFTVEEVWAGDVPGQVVVRGGPDEPGVATSVDRTWAVGETYLVLPRVDGGQLQDDSCDPTREWSEDLAEFRPAGVHAPEPVDGVGAGRNGLVVGSALAVLALAVVATVVAVRPRQAAP